MEHWVKEKLKVRRLIGNAVLAIVLTMVILLSSVNAAAVYSLAQVHSNDSQGNYFTITGCPSSTAGGQSFSGITITAYNSIGAILTDYTGQVWFTSSDSRATLPYTPFSNYTFTTGITGDNGVHVFSGFNLVTAGSQTITVTDGSMSATSAPITVNHNSAIGIGITPKTATVTAGSVQVYSASASDYYGNLWDVTGLTSWSISTGAGGSWSSNTYTSAQNGTWVVTGTYMGFQDSASLTTNHAGSISIMVNPKNPSVTAGLPVTFTSIASDSFGNAWDVTGSTSWSISSGAGGSWSNNIYMPAKAGTWTVTANYSSYSDTASLTVTHASAHTLALTPRNPTVAAGSSVTFIATAFDSYGNPWDVSSSTLWFIDSGAQGSWVGNVYTSAKVGIWTATGVNGGLFDQVSLTVGYSLTFNITISPKASTIGAGSSQTFSATASDIYGNVWDVTSQTAWAIDASAGGYWTSNVYTSALAGTWTVTGTYRGISDIASLTVTHGDPVRIVVGSIYSTTQAGTSVTYTATAFDSFGSSWDVSISTHWMIDSGAQGSWAANVYTAAKTGLWTITGGFDNLYDQTSLTVTPGSPTAIAVSPSTTNLVAGSSQTFTATATDHYANNWDVSSTTSWTINTNAGGFWSNNVYTSEEAAAGQ